MYKNTKIFEIKVEQGNISNRKKIYDTNKLINQQKEEIEQIK